MTATIHLVKLSVGTSSIGDLQKWQSTRAAQGTDGLPRHVTRMWPKREQELLAGGSIYWVIKGVIQCRQKIIRFDEVVRKDGIRRCAIVLEPKYTRTSPVVKKTFQGWRYLKIDKAPPDLGMHRDSDDELPPELAGELAKIGVI